MRVGITLGDPAGVGPALVVRALAEDGGRDVIVFGDPLVLDEASRRAALPTVGELGAEVVPVTRLEGIRPGQPTAAGGAAQVAYLEAAVAAAKRYEVDALCTAPIHKAAAERAGFAFPGHTEFLAVRFGVGRVAMMLAGPHLRVVLATTHVALARVPKVLTVDGIASVIGLTVEALHEDFGLAKPRVAVCALNPHAGEEGLFGDEEARLIEPAIRAVTEGPLGDRLPFDLEGPEVPDAVFRLAAAPPFGEGAFDAVVAMYHDQGLIPLKLVDFDAAVNVTLGLPMPRTSPDHGVAYDAARSGQIRDGSFRAALELARRLSTSPSI